MEISPPLSSCKKLDISLRPQKDKQVLESCSSKISFINDIHPFVEEQQTLMKELYSLTNTDYRYKNFSGVYPRINYLQDTPAQEIRK